MANRLIGLAVILLVALLPVAQGIAATSFEVKPMVEASVMLPDTQALHDCARLNAQGSCNSPCSTAHVGKSALTDSVLLLSSFCSVVIWLCSMHYSFHMCLLCLCYVFRDFVPFLP